MPDGQAGSAPRQSQHDADLPTWDLADLYPGPESPELRADLQRAEADAKRFSAAHAARVAAMPCRALA